VIRIARNAATVVLLALLISAQWGKRSDRMDPSRMRAEKDHAFLYPIDVPHSDAESVGRSTLELFENGRPLGPAHALHDQIRELGRGRFSHWGRLVYFSSSDDSDPRTNGRKYEIRHDSPPSPLWILALLTALVALESRRLGRGLAALERVNPAWPALAIGLCALGFRIWVYAHYHEQTLGHLVKGVPVSDGAWWDAKAAAFASGDSGAHLVPFVGLRPFRWMFMGAIYALTGPSVTVTQIVQLFLGALSALLVFETLRRLAPMSVAIAGAAFLAFSLVDARYALTTASEPLGEFLAIAFLLLFVLAAQGWQRWLWLAAGVAFGLTNLTRPEFMPAIAGLPVALAIVLSRRGAQRPAWRTAGIAAVLFGAGIIATMGPWMLRQRIRFGTWQISVNGAEVMFAASSPIYRSWSPEVSALAAGLDTRQRAAFYNARLSENLHHHLGFYIKNASQHAWAVAKRLSTRPPLVLALLFLIPGALGANPDRRRLIRVLLPAAGLAVLLWLLPDAQLHWIWLSGLVAALVLRAPMLFIAAFVAAPIIALGMTAMTDERLLYSLEWPAFALAAWSFSVVLGGVRTESVERTRWARAGVIARRLAVAGVVLLGIGATKAIASHRELPQPIVVGGADASQWIDRALADPAAAAYAPFRDRLEVRVIGMRPDYVMHFSTGESVAHWNPLFSQPRPYGFDVAQPVQESYYVFPAGLRLPRSGDVTVIGFDIQRPMTGSSFEVIAFAGHDGAIHHPDAAVARLHASALGAPN
jgi:hypothetical protein